MERIHILYGGIIDYEPNFLSNEQANKLYSELKDSVLWEQKFYTNYKTGEKFPQPRLTAWYADNPNMEYSYSGVTQKVYPWTPILIDIKNKIEEITKSSYNSVLLNFYRNGSDSVGSHADDEKELGINANIASLSLGETRAFELSNYKVPKDKSICNLNEKDLTHYEFPLSNGSLLVMSGTTQHYWKHAVPKSKSISNGRINLTFRKFYA